MASLVIIAGCYQASPMSFLPHNWDSFLYQFIIGGIILLFGLFYPFIKGDASWSRREDRDSIVVILVGIVLFIIFFVLWQLYAIGGG